MIEGIDIYYFQSHVNTSIDFHPKTTAITGLSMDGKTAILRAFDQVRTNRPLGVGRIHRFDNEPMKIIIRVDGHKVGFLKGKTPIDEDGNKNMYWIDFPNGERKEFKTVGLGPPPEDITNILNVSDISIQKQLDAYLLVTSTSGEITKTINKITGLSEAERWVKDLTKGIRSLNKEDGILTEQLNENKKELSKYDGVDEFRKDIITLKEMQVKYDKGVEQMAYIMDTINVIAAKESELNMKQREAEKLSGLLSEWDELNSKAAEREAFLEKVLSLINTEDKKEKLEADLAILNPLYEEILKINEKISSLENIRSIRNNYVNTSNALEAANQQLSETKAEYTNELIKLGKCFTCGNDVSDPEILRKNLKWTANM